MRGGPAPTEWHRQLGDWPPRHDIPNIGIATTGTAAIAKIDLLRMHAAELHVAPAIGEFFDCKCWRNEAESVFFGHWADVERAHVMLAAVRSTMEREFRRFLRDWYRRGKSESSGGKLFEGHGTSDQPALATAQGWTVRYRPRERQGACCGICQPVSRGNSRRATPSISTIAYEAGVEAGDRVELPRRGSRLGNGH